MKAVSDILLDTIKELQQLPSLTGSVLGGGTNLAIRYGHRQSYDIDLFFPGIIGKNGFEAILKEAKETFKEGIFGVDYPCNIDDQFIFQRFYIRKGDISIKVEILQNMQTNDEPDIIAGIRLMSERDIGLLKLMTASNRANDKDIYDLDYLTDNLPLGLLMEQLKEKEDQYHEDVHRTIFDLDNELSPVENADLLLKFEAPGTHNNSRPGHSNPRRDIVEGSKNWLSARSGWRRKVRAYFRSIGKDFPEVSAQ